MPGPSGDIDPQVAGRIQLVVLDVDGVLTDGGVYVGARPGQEDIELKRFDIQDGLGIKMLGAVDKVREAGAPSVAVTERGTFFGYGDLIVDMRSFQRIRTACGVPVIFDGTHSVQRPGRLSGSSGGTPEFVPPLVLAAVAAGCDGLFLEVHPNPENAPSDGSTMLPLDQLKPLLERVTAIRAASGEVDSATFASAG